MLEAGADVADIGLTEAEARDLYGDRLEVARFDFAHNDRAVAERRGKGLAKVMVVRGRPVGASIAGHQAGDQIALWALAVSGGLKMGQVAGMVAPYPTFAEVNKRVAGAYFSPKLFDSQAVKRVVRAVQRWIP